ncbi:type II/IV secretion system protein [Candidatus Berkelbacteria bacterium]|nr:type II/IV secretion system protein [Candidatus Berkelbacteria bacterium]
MVDYPFQLDDLAIIPEEIISKLLVVSFFHEKRRVKVASPAPTNPELIKFLTEFATANDYVIDLYVCSMSSFTYAQKVIKINTKIEPEAESTPGQVQAAQEVSSNTDKIKLAKQLENVNTTEALDVLFAGAMALRASDIHLEPTEKILIIRLRIDGVLQPLPELNLSLYKSLRSRLKFLSKMKLDITSVPQDGRFEFKTIQKAIDVRVSAVPTPYGESFVMRLLTGDSQAIKLEELGFFPEQINIIRNAISKPNGLILNTGPTGSGKTTTLYSILQELNKPGVKILTIEDPIEYKIKGVQQSQIEPNKGYDFATALKSSLRQDPDIIMVGEIRDPETATTAVQAALTGHLVLSTLHTNSAAGAIPRLLDMGVKSFLLSGVINLVIAQRLVRRLKYPDKAGDDRYEGRVAIAELLVPDRNIETLIQQKASIDQFNQTTHEMGMISMAQDGVAKVKAGLTTQEEVDRVAKDDLIENYPG